MAVAYQHVVNVGVLLEADDLHTILRLIAGDILHIDVANGGVVATTANLIVLVVEVDFQDRLLADAYLDVAHVDILDDATTTGVGLDTQYALQLGRVHHTIVGIHILTTARDLRAYHHATMSVLHLAIADDDVLRRHVALTSVAIASALDGDTVVARIEETVLDEYAIAALGIASVAIRSVVDHLYTTNGDIGGVEGMDNPEG